MTDMSFPAFGAADEFGELDHLVLPGQDPELLHRIHAGFIAELGPANFIERLWARDMAIQTAWAEYVRTATCAAHRHVQEGLAPADAARSEASADASEADAGASDADGKAPQPSNRAIGKAYAENLSLFEGLIGLEHAMIGERNRLIRQYDERTGIVKAYGDAMALLKELQEEQNDS